MPGYAARLEQGYYRYGTKELFGNFHVATGKLWTPLLRGTRGKSVMLENISNLIRKSGEDETYRFTADKLNTLCSETVVQIIAALTGRKDDLRDQRPKQHFNYDQSSDLSDCPSHLIHLFFTQLRCSWLNQIEICYGTLRRKLLRRMSVRPVTHQEEQLGSFIDCYNQTLAKLYQWTYRGTLLAS